MTSTAGEQFRQDMGVGAFGRNIAADFLEDLNAAQVADGDTMRIEFQDSVHHR